MFQTLPEPLRQWQTLQVTSPASPMTSYQLAHLNGHTFKFEVMYLLRGGAAPTNEAVTHSLCHNRQQRGWSQRCLWDHLFILYIVRMRLILLEDQVHASITPSRKCLGQLDYEVKRVQDPSWVLGWGKLRSHYIDLTVTERETPAWPTVLAAAMRSGRRPLL